jgi:spermidine synthase
MPEKWFFESLYPDIKLGLKVTKALYRGKSKFQNIKILETPRFGTVLVLDGVIQTTSGDEFIYHEMMTHIPMFSHPNPETVLIIGGGDGGVLREVLKHKTVKKVTLVEIDKKVIEYSEKYLKSIAKNSFRSSKLELIISDGAEFVKNKKGIYDIAIIDSPDPIGPAKVLFQKKFYTDIYNILKPNGIMVRQSGSTFLQKEELRENYKILSRIFPYNGVYTAAIPTYIGGLFSFIFSSKKVDPKKLDGKKIASRYKQAKIKTRYYNPEIHIASFQTPNYIKEIIGGEK